MTQGEGGIWCVEQIWFAGEFPQRQVVRPDTDLPMAEYYAELQAQADTGQADWSLDPMEVCLRYAHSFQGGHLNATSESFALSRSTPPPRTAAMTGGGRPERSAA